MPNGNLISIVIPCLNEASTIPHLKKALTEFGHGLNPRYRCEFLLIDDGSTDTTWEQIVSFGQEDERVRGISFSRNFGHQIAITCGYDLAKGDAVVTMDADLQDPPEVIHDMIRHWEKGFDVVYAVRLKRYGESRFKLFTARIFYRIFKRLSKLSSPADAGDFRLMSRRSVDALKEMREKFRYIRGMVGWLGFKSIAIEYERKPRAAGHTKFGFLKMLSFAMDSLVSFSSKPLQLTYLLAFLGIVPVMLYLLYTLFAFFAFGKELVPGWTSLLLSISIFGFSNLLCLGLMGEYIGRIYDETKSRPLYLIQETTCRNAPRKGPKG